MPCANVLAPFWQFKLCYLSFSDIFKVATWRTPSTFATLYLQNVLGVQGKLQVIPLCVAAGAFFGDNSLLSWGSKSQRRVSQQFAHAVNLGCFGCC